MQRSAAVGRALLVLLFCYLFSLGATWNGVLIPPLKFLTLGLMTGISLLWLLAHLRGGWRWYQTWLDPVLPLWVAAFGLSILSNTDVWRRSAIGLWYMVAYLLAWYLLNDALANGAVRRSTLIDAFLFAGGVIILIGWFQVAGSDFDLAKLDFPRPGSLIGNPNALGSMLVVLLLLAAGRLLAVQHPVGRYALTVYCLLTAMLLFLTFSRGAWAGAAAGSAVFIATMRTNAANPLAGLTEWVRGNPRFAVAGSAIALAVIVGLSVVIVDSLQQPGRSVNLRANIYEDALTIFAEKPLTGQGLFAFGRALERLDSMPPAQPHSHAHNAVLQVMAEMGMVGLAALIPTVWLALRQMRRLLAAESTDRMATAGAVAAVIGFGVHHLLDAPFMMPAIALAGLLALALATADEQPAPMTIWWRRMGHPIGMASGTLLLLISGFWGVSIYADYARALDLVNDDQYRAAADELQSVIDADPELAIYYMEQGFLYGMAASEGDVSALPLAIAAYERFVELEPQSAAGWANLAALYFENAARGRAIAAMSNAVEEAPASWQLWLNLGLYAEANDAPDIAIEAYRRAISPDNRALVFWDQTDLRREAAVAIEPSPFAEAAIAISEGRPVPGGFEIGGADQTSSVIFELLVALSRGEDVDAEAYLSQAGALIEDDEDRAWVSVGWAYLAQSVGQDDTARTQIEAARAFLAVDIPDEDYVFGVNIGYFQFLRYVIPRQFVPQLYYPTASPLLLRLIDAF
jgi:O-antigen ligase